MFSNQLGILHVFSNISTRTKSYFILVYVYFWFIDNTIAIYLQCKIPFLKLFIFKRLDPITYADQAHHTTSVIPCPTEAILFVHCSRYFTPENVSLSFVPNVWSQLVTKSGSHDVQTWRPVSWIYRLLQISVKIKKGWGLTWYSIIPLIYRI